MLIKKKKERKHEPWSRWNCHIHHPPPKARLTDWHEKQMCQSHLLLADSPAVVVPTSFLWHSAGLVVQRKRVTARLSALRARGRARWVPGTNATARGSWAQVGLTRRCSIAGVLATKNTCRGEAVVGESRAAVGEVMPQKEGIRDGSSDQSLSTKSRVSLSSDLSSPSSAALAADISTGREWEEEYSIPLLWSFVLAQVL